MKKVPKTLKFIVFFSLISFCFLQINPQEKESPMKSSVQQDESLPSIELVSPKSGEKDLDKISDFTWKPEISLSKRKGLTYNLKIIEIRENQTPFHAMKFNTAWFEKKNISATSFTYLASARKLEKNKTFAWQVIATIDKEEIERSEVRSFGKKDQPKLMTREEAIGIIINTVIIPATLDHKLVAFLGKEMLRSGDTIWPYFEEERGKTISRPTWFAWLNDDPQAFFEHNTRYVFLDAITGKVDVIVEKWWPVVNNVSLYMSDEEWSDPNLIIYSDIHIYK